VEVETALPADTWSAMVDPEQLESTLLSLAVNARDAMPDGGRLTISTANAELGDDAPAVIEGEIAAGPYVMITVADTGHGMPEEVVERAYEPFFTTKDVGQGTGLGLSMVHGFIKQSGGHIEIASIPDGGTTITLYLPGAGQRGAGQASLGVDGPASSAAEHRGRGQTILVVEDDPAVRSIAVAMLGNLGYTTVEAENHDSALSVLEATPSVVLLFTDVILPSGGNGFDIAHAARQRRPDIKVLYATGYSEEAVARAAANSGGGGAVELIFKPYRKEELARRLAEQFAG
jgi:CheY-like chemotaxis protein